MKNKEHLLEALRYVANNAQKSPNDSVRDIEVVPAAFAERLERERDEARVIARYWQEQFCHAEPERDWQDFPWENVQVKS